MRVNDRVLNGATFFASVAALATAGFIVLRQDARVIPSGPSEPLALSEWEHLAEAGHRLGPVDAPVTIIEFGDYECAACVEWQKHIEALLRRYHQDIAFVYRHWPLTQHRYAYGAARAAECAGAQGKFWPFHRLLFENPDWFGNAMIRFAEHVGVADLSEFSSCMETVGTVPAIEADIAAVKEIGGRGTPTILVNGMMLGTERDSTYLSGIIESIIKDQQQTEPSR